MSVKKTL